MQFALLRGNYVIWWVPSSYGLVLLGILRLMAEECQKFFISGEYAVQTHRTRLFHYVFPQAVDIAVFADDHTLLQRHMEFRHRLLAGLQIAAIHIRAVDDLNPHDVVLLCHWMGRLLTD